MTVHICSEHDGDLPVVDNPKAKFYTEEINLAESVDLSQVFNLSSLPESAHTIYLDFTGHTTKDTPWNTYFKISEFGTPSYSKDGDLAKFSNDELASIYYIWLRVAEDFAPFNVNVTTKEPTDIQDINKTDLSDKRWGIRVCIGGSGAGWYPGRAGGVAFVGSFNWNQFTPCFVFSNNVGTGNEKYTAEAISHEVGHALGLSHDGGSAGGYYYGHGGGETGWGTILGAGYYANLTQWSKGEYLNANNPEDDLQIIVSQNGFTYRVDDCGDTITTAKPLNICSACSGTVHEVTAQGIIERNTDVDFYSFNTASGLIKLSINGAKRGTNLDILAELYDSIGKPITTSNNIDALSANIELEIQAGTYYLKIEGIGKGDPKGTGYSDYGSLGQYFISGTIQKVNQPPETLPTISIDDVTVNEGSTGLVDAVFTIKLSRSTDKPVNVEYTTSSGTANETTDYIKMTGKALIPPGQTEFSLKIPIIGDAGIEGNENFTVILSNATNATIVDNQGLGTIINDDSIINNGASVGDIAIPPGSNFAIFKMILSAIPKEKVFISYQTLDGTGKAGTDYKATSGRLILYPGQIARDFNIPLIPGSVSAGKTFLINLSKGVNATITDNQAMATFA